MIGPKEQEHHPIVEQCEGCARIHNGKVCEAYYRPAYWFENGRTCPLATHLKKNIETSAKKPEGWRQRKQRNKKR